MTDLAFETQIKLYFCQKRKKVLWTYTVQVDMKASTAFRYETGGRAA